MRRTGPVEIVRPRDLAEALALASQGARPVAGGTDLFVRIRKETETAKLLVYVGELPELRGMWVSAGGVEIGAAVTHAELLAHPATERLPILRLAVNTVGSPAIRTMGTLGGNVVNASPAADGLVPLYLLAARVRLVSGSGEREVPVERFVLGPGRTDLRPGELVRSIVLPYPDGEPSAYFRKVGRRRALLIAVASLGALVWIEDGVVREARLALGSVAPTVLRPREVEQALVGRPLRPDAWADLRDALAAAVEPISDLRASADYRRRVSGNLLLDLVQSLAHGQLTTWPPPR